MSDDAFQTDLPLWHEEVNLDQITLWWPVLLGFDEETGEAQVANMRNVTTAVILPVHPYIRSGEEANRSSATRNKTGGGGSGHRMTLSLKAGAGELAQMEYLNQSGISLMRYTRMVFYLESESRNWTRAQLQVSAGKHRHWHALLRCAWLKRDVMLGRRVAMT